MATAPKKTAAPPATAATIAHTMIHGFAVQINGFIPIPKNDLKKQVEVSTLMLEIEEGKKTIADLAAHMKQVEYRAQHLGRRVESGEAANWFKSKDQIDLEEAIAKQKADEEAKAKAAETKTD
jgi:hypothetical protein